MPLITPNLKQKLDDFNSKKAIKEILIKQYQIFGYIIKPGDVFYKAIFHETGEEVWGLKVGQFTHSCHIDTSEIIVLFFVDRKPEVKTVRDDWLIDLIIV